MADPSPARDADADGGGTPRWVKLFGIAALVVVLLVVVRMLIGGGHGPGLHTSFGIAGGQTPPSSALEDYAPSA